MSVSTRNKTAALLAVFGGVLLFIGGSIGMVGFLSELEKIILNILGEENAMVETIFWILILIAALGGISVIIGGLLIYKSHIISGKFLIALGAGIGIIGLFIGLISALYQGKGDAFFGWLTTSFVGIGIVLSIVARLLAKRSSADNKKDNKSKKRR
jgi:hypothetical protein